jgi:uncharacterized protein YjbI with pentapeptide repeats
LSEQKIRVVRSVCRWRALAWQPAPAINLHGAIANGVEFTGVNLHDAKLSGAQLGESIFYLADLVGADLRGANLNHAILRSSNMGATWGRPSRRERSSPAP